MKVEKGTPIDSKDRIAEKILEGMRQSKFLQRIGQPEPVSLLSD